MDTSENHPHDVLLRQAAKRILVVVSIAMVAVTLVAIGLQRVAMDKYAQNTLSSLEMHYASRILLLEQEWQEHAVRLHARLETQNLFQNSITSGWDNLRLALMQENHDLFPILLVVGRDDRVLFKFHAISAQIPELFSAPRDQGWFADAQNHRLFRWYAQPLWLGDGGRGRLLMFVPMDNGLLFRNAMPATDLFLVRNSEVWASTTGQKDQDALMDRLIARREDHGHIDHQVAVTWGDPRHAPPRLVVRHHHQPLFSVKELMIAGLIALLLSILVLWLALGEWILHHTHRIVALGRISRRFIEGDFFSEKILLELKTIQEKSGDEISQVAESLATLTRTVDQHTRIMERDAHQLHESEARFRSLTNSLLDTVVAFDGTGRIHYGNKVADDLFAPADERLVDKPISTLFCPRWLGEAWQEKLIPTGDQDAFTTRTLEGMAKGTGDQEFPVEISVSPWNRGTEAFYTAVIRNISERRALESRDLRAYVNRVAIGALLEIGLEPLTLRRKLEIALEIILTVPWLAVKRKGSIFLVTADNHLEMLVQKGLHNHLLTACQRIPFGYCLCGRAAATKEIVISQELDHRHDVTYDGITQHGHYCVPILLKGELLGVLNLYVDHHHRYDPEEEAFLATIANTLAGVVDRGLVEERVHHIATHDTLTNIPNRMLFKELLEQTIKQAVRQHTQFAVAFFDLDHFKQVNDTLGHDAGDALLLAVAERVRGCLRESDTLARMGGDEFTLILPNSGNPEKALLVAEKIVDALQQPFVLAAGHCQVGTSMGISLFPEHSLTGDGLLQKADHAMYTVKRRGRNAAAIYDISME